MTKYAIVNANIKIVVHCLTCKNHKSLRNSDNIDCPYFAECRYNNYSQWEYVRGKEKIIQMEREYETG